MDEDEENVVHVYGDFEFKMVGSKVLYRARESDCIAEKTLNLISNDNDWKEFCDGYTTAVTHLHPEINWFTTELGQYQGEWYALGYDNENNIYFHQGSFGSCSGCDWYQSLKTFKDWMEFIHSMGNIIKIGKTKEEAEGYLQKTLANTWGEGKEAIGQLVNAMKNWNIQ